MKSKVFLFNGPPRSGKDTACYHLYSQYARVVPMKFAEPLHAFAQKLISPGDIAYYTNEGKNEIIPYLRKSYRDICISLSEEYSKYHYGYDVFGHAFVARAKWWTEEAFTDGINFVVSDSGFDLEITPLVDYFGAENIILVRIEREGCTFEGDSRSYIDLDHHGINYISIKNETLEQFKADVDKIYLDHAHKVLVVPPA